MDRLLVIQHCGEVGGSGIGLLSTLNMLRNKYDIIVYCVNTPDDLTKLYQSYGFKTKPIKCVYGFNYFSGGPALYSVDFWGSLFRIKNAKMQWKRIFQEEKPNIVLVNSIILNWMWEPIKGCGAIGICHVREVLPNRRNIRALYSLRNLENFDAVWFISEYDCKYFSLKRPITAIVRDSLRDRIMTSFDCSYSDENNHEFRVLYLGGLSRLKGLPTLIKSIEYLDDGIVLYLAGYYAKTERNAIAFPKSFQEIKTAIIKLSKFNMSKLWRQLEKAQEMWSNRIRVVGHSNDISKLYSESDVLVFPSAKPHQSRPAFEAGFFCKPVIISDFVQTQESIKNGYNGLTFSPNDPISLAEAVNRLARDKSLCIQLGKNNYQNSIQNHTYETVSRNLDEFWDIMNKYLISRNNKNDKLNN